MIMCKSTHSIMYLALHFNLLTKINEFNFIILQEPLIKIC